MHDGPSAKRLAVARITLSRLWHGQTAISAEMALALERIGWSNTEFWLRLQANYDLATNMKATPNADT